MTTQSAQVAVDQRRRAGRGTSPYPLQRASLSFSSNRTYSSEGFGRTVNIAARIAARAGAGEVLTSEETLEVVKDARLRFVRVGPASLKGVARPVTLYRVLRNGHDLM